MTTLNARRRRRAAALRADRGHRRDRLRAARPRARDRRAQRRSDRARRGGAARAPGRARDRAGRASGRAAIRRNRDFAAAHVETQAADELLALAYDPQTAGGLLISVAADAAPCWRPSFAARASSSPASAGASRPAPAWSSPDGRHGGRRAARVARAISPARYLPLAVASAVSLYLIVISGALVRLTASGLALRVVARLPGRRLLPRVGEHPHSSSSATASSRSSRSCSRSRCGSPAPRTPGCRAGDVDRGGRLPRHDRPGAARAADDQLDLHPLMVMTHFLLALARARGCHRACRRGLGQRARARRRPRLRRAARDGARARRRVQHPRRDGHVLDGRRPASGRQRRDPPVLEPPRRRLVHVRATAAFGISFPRSSRLGRARTSRRCRGSSRRRRCCLRSSCCRWPSARSSAAISSRGARARPRGARGRRLGAGRCCSRPLSGGRRLRSRGLDFPRWRARSCGSRSARHCERPCSWRPSAAGTTAARARRSPAAISRGSGRRPLRRDRPRGLRRLPGHSPARVARRGSVAQDRLARERLLPRPDSRDRARRDPAARSRAEPPLANVLRARGRARPRLRRRARRDARLAPRRRAAHASRRR